MTKLWITLLIATSAAAGVLPRGGWDKDKDNGPSKGGDHWKDHGWKDHGWDKDKYKGGKGRGGDHGHGHDDDDDHDHGHGGHDNGDKGCDLTIEDIMNSPNVPVRVKYPVEAGTGTVADFISSGKIPAVNGTRATLNGELPANLGDASTSKAGASGQFGPQQGTNRNAAMFRYARGGEVVSRQLTPDLQGLQLNLSAGADFEGRKLAVNAQPDVPLPNPDASLRCEYAYEHVLGGNGTTPRGALWALEGYVDLVAADVKQGGIGDCGMGAAVMALAAGGWTRYLKAMFLKRFDTPSPGDRNIVAVFRRDGKVQPVLIDDQLPTLQNANPNCWQYPGFQPVNDAAYPDVTKPTPIFFMPLFEKVSALASWPAAASGPPCPSHEHGQS